MNYKRDADITEKQHVSHCILLAKTVLNNFGRNTICIMTICCVCVCDIFSITSIRVKPVTDGEFNYKLIHSTGNKYAEGLVCLL